MAKKAKTNKKGFTADFDLEKETKNCYRYSLVLARGTFPKIKTLYFQKETFGGDNPPNNLQVEVSWTPQSE